MAYFNDSENQNDVSIDELVMMFYDEKFFLKNENNKAALLVKDAVIEYVFNNCEKYAFA